LFNNLKNKIFVYSCTETIERIRIAILFIEIVILVTASTNLQAWGRTHNT